MLEDGHIFTIKTKDAANVTAIKAGGDGIVISGLNVLKDQIRAGDFVFVVFGGDKPKGWKPGLVGLAHIVKTPFDEGYDGGKNFRVAIDVDVYFEPSIVRGDLITYPDTFDTIGIGPITKWEPNQAITSVPRRNAFGLLQAICDLRPSVFEEIRVLLGIEFEELRGNVRRFVVGTSQIGKPAKIIIGDVDLREEFVNWLYVVDGKAKKSVENYLRALDSIGEPFPDGTDGTYHTTEKWPGIYEYLTARKAKRIFNVGTTEKLLAEYGMFDLLFADQISYGPLDQGRYDTCRQWAEGDNHRSLKNAYAAYKRFLKWREAQNKNKEEPLPANVDWLGIALKLFAEKRAVDKPSGWDSYDAWTHGVRTDFVAVDESLLANPAFDYLAYSRKFAISWQVANTKFASHSDDEKHAVLKFLKAHKDAPKPASWYIDMTNRLVVGGNLVKGMSPKAVLYFMSELHPEEFAAWTEPTYEQLAFLGLHKGATPNDLTIETYEDCKSKQQLIVVRMKELGIGKASDDPSAPDYRTANEFLWWIGQDDNKDLIKEKVMSKKMKTEAPKKYDEGKRKKLAFDPNSKDDELLLRLLAALRAKPFAILAGHSGTGKSRYVKKLAYMTCNMDELRNENQLPGNYLLLQVKPNWHDSTELLGFRNALDGNRYQKTKLIEFLFRAYQFKDTPFFLCLDEMNLAPVEQYFAEFLSSMESSEPVPLNDITVEDDNLFNLGCEWKAAYDYLAVNGFSIPKNLFIVGTVNMDETTNQFSRKVLDRAFTIEMTDVDFKNYGHVTPPSYADTIEEEKIQALLSGEKFVDKLDAEDVAENALLVKVQKALEPTAFAVAYRFANEYTLLKRAIACFDKDSTMKLDALDQAVLMKILPRVAGEKDYIEKVYGKNENEGLRKALEGKSVSLKKIAEIMKRANEMNAQYITFWP